MANKSELQKEVLKALGLHIRKLGFKGSGQNYRREEGDFIFIINVQSSSSGNVFYVNLGAQPTFIPAESSSALATLKEYECVFRKRVGKDWPWTLDANSLVALSRELDSTQNEFFGLIRSLPASIANDTVDVLLEKFGGSSPSARTALHLARAAIHLKCHSLASTLVEYGLNNAGDRATILIYELKLVRSAIDATSVIQT